MSKASKQKRNRHENGKSFYGEMKSIFDHFESKFSFQIVLELRLHL